MRLYNETLSELKAYARKEYALNSNVPVLVMLITEEEHSILKDYLTNITKTQTQTNQKDQKQEEALNYSEAFFPDIAIITELEHNYSSKQTPVVTTMLREAFEIPNFSKYKYAILIREEQLLNWGSQMNIIVDGVQAQGKIRKTVILYRILTLEFLHIIEKEKGIQIFTDNQTQDAEIAHRAFENIKIFKHLNIFPE
jgi:hypothetical protein